MPSTEGMCYLPLWKNISFFFFSSLWEKSSYILLFKPKLCTYSPYSGLDWKAIFIRVWQNILRKDVFTPVYRLAHSRGSTNTWSYCSVSSVDNAENNAVIPHFQGSFLDQQDSLVKSWISWEVTQVGRLCFGLQGFKILFELTSKASEISYT